MRRSRLRGVAWLCAALTVGACSPGPSGTAGSDSYGAQWQRRLPAVLEAASEFERQILNDGKVTSAENDRAVLAYVACIEDAGVAIVQLERDADGQIETLSVGGGEDEDADPSEVVDGCKAEFYQFTPDGYHAALHPDWTEQTLIQAIAECLRDRGVTVDASVTTQDELLRAAEEQGRRSDLGECSSEVQ